MITMNTDEVSLIVSEPKIKNSSGLDDINNVCLTSLSRREIKFLTFMFNACFKLNYYPKDFKESKIVPIRKPINRLNAITLIDP